MSLSPFSMGGSPPSLPASLSLSSPLYPSLDPSFSLYPSILSSLCSPHPLPSPNMCYSNIAARTQCFSMPQDRQSITAWLSPSIGSEPPLAQPKEEV